MRTVERVCGDVLRPAWVFRTETESEPRWPGKICPSAAVINKSHFGESSEYDASSEQTTASASCCLPPEKSDSRSDNMSRSVLTECKYTK